MSEAEPGAPGKVATVGFDAALAPLLGGDHSAAMAALAAAEGPHWSDARGTGTRPCLCQWAEAERQPAAVVPWPFTLGRASSGF